MKRVPQYGRTEVLVRAKVEPVNIDVRDCPTTSWRRPDDWLDCDMPTAPEDESFAGLCAIFPEEDNYLAVRANIVGGGFSVDWGDGTVDHWSDNAHAWHKYDFDSIDPGTEIEVSGVRARQVVVRVIPDDGRAFSELYLHEDVPGFPSGYNAGWLEICFASKIATRFRASEYSTAGRSYELRSATLLLESLNYAGYLFYGCLNLRHVNSFDTSKCSDFSYMFGYCLRIQRVPAFDTSLGTRFYRMFYMCRNLLEVPPLDTSRGTSFYGMLHSCNSITTLPPLDLRNATDLQYFLPGCERLLEIPDHVLWPSGPVRTYDVFSSTIVHRVPALDPGWFRSHFYFSMGIREAFPVIRFSDNEDGYSTFMYCFNLRRFPVIEGRPRRIRYFGYQCFSVRGTVEIDCTLVTDAYAAFYLASGLEGAKLHGLTVTTSFYNCSMTREGIVDLFNSLGTAKNSSQYIDLRYNPGNADLTPEDIAIATGKGWTLRL